MGSTPARPASRIGREAVSLVASLALAMLMIQHSATRKQQHR